MHHCLCFYILNRCFILLHVHNLKTKIYSLQFRLIKGEFSHFKKTYISLLF